MHTVISAFDNRATAQRAVERLVDAGFALDDVHLQQAPASTTAETEDDRVNQELGERTMDTAEREIAFDRGVLASIGHFFTSLFGRDNPSGHADVYSEAVRRGSSVVVVDARDDIQAEKAAKLLHDMGAIDVDERAQQWQGWAVNTPSTAASSQDIGGVRVFTRPSPEPLRDIMPPRESSMSANSTPPRDRAANDANAGSPRDEREAIRERAFAANRAAEPSVSQRDPDANRSTDPSASRNDTNKPR